MTVTENHSLTIPSYDRLFFYSDDETINEKNLQKIVEYIANLTNKNIELQNVLFEVLKDGDLKVRISPADKIAWPAYWDTSNRTIVMKNFIDKKYFFDAFVYELCNANNPYFKKGTEESMLITFDAHQTSESYARMLELAEYSTMVSASDIFEFAKKHRLWPSSICRLRSKENGFDEYWASVNHKGRDLPFSHADSYRHNFTLQTAAYENLRNQLDENSKVLQGALQNFINPETDSDLDSQIEETTSVQLKLDRVKTNFDDIENLKCHSRMK